MKRDRRWIALTLSCVMAASAAFPVFAAPTGPAASANVGRYDEETKARLEDQVIEFDEIQNLIHEYNPMISELWRQYEEGKEDMQGVLTELESRYRELDEDISDAKDDLKAGIDIPSSMETVIIGEQATIPLYRATLKGIRESIGAWDSAKSTKQLRQAEKMTTSGVQSAFIGYHMIQVNMEMLRTMVQMYERQAQIADRQVALGLGTDSTLLSAKSSLLTAQTQLASLAIQMDSVRRSVCELLGFDPETNPEIRALPEFDMSRLDGMNLEQDTKKAIGNNYTLIAQRNSEKGKTMNQVANRLKMIDEGDQKLTIEMQRLYQDVLDKKAAYEAAQTGYAAAEQSRGASERMYANGMLSEAEYIGTQIAYCQKKAAKESANLELWQAMETYNWAIDGQATVE